MSTTCIYFFYFLFVFAIQDILISKKNVFAKILRSQWTTQPRRGSITGEEGCDVPSPIPTPSLQALLQ
jgi:hypothetical protein